MAGTSHTEQQIDQEAEDMAQPEDTENKASSEPGKDRPADEEAVELDINALQEALDEATAQAADN